jgi:hypothetical protein
VYIHVVTGLNGAEATVYRSATPRRRICMAGLEIKSLASPEEVRPFKDDKGAAHIVNLTPGPVGRACLSLVGAGRRT